MVKKQQKIVVRIGITAFILAAGLFLNSATTLAEDVCIPVEKWPHDKDIVPDSYESRLLSMCSQKKKADLGDVNAQVSVGEYYYFNEKFIGHDDAEAFKWFLKAAEQGNPGGDCYLGRLYRDGRGVHQDYNEAAKRFHICAKYGGTEALESLSHLYSEGHGVEKSDIEAYFWLRLANYTTKDQKYAIRPGPEKEKIASQKLTSTQIAEVEKRVHNWKPEPWPHPRSPYLKKLEDEAESGRVHSQLELAYSYSTGVDGVKDIDKALKWYVLAAESGDIGAMYSAALLFKDKGNETEAFKWTYSAASHDHEWAQLDLATRYENGIGVKQDYVEAYFWQALILSHAVKIPPIFAENAPRWKEELKQHLTPEQVTEQEQRVKNWKPEGRAP